MVEDVEYRWNSTYLMLHAAIKYRHVLDSFVVSFNGALSQSCFREN